MSVAKRIAKTTVGLVLLVVGGVLLVLPGPGLLLILAGLVVLASEYEWAERRLDPIGQRAWQASRASVSGPLRIAGSVLAGGCLVGAGIVWAGHPDLPLGGASTGSSLILSGVVLWGLLGYSYVRLRRERQDRAGGDPAGSGGPAAGAVNRSSPG